MYYKDYPKENFALFSTKNSSSNALIIIAIIAILLLAFFLIYRVLKFRNYTNESINN